MEHDFAVIFDMDGVIIDSNPFHKITLRQFAEKYGYHLSEEELITKVYGRPNKDWIQRLFGKAMNTTELATYGEEKEQLFRDIFKDVIAPVDGLIEFMERLKLKEVTMAIATSAPRSNVDFVLQHIPIGPYFKVILDESSVTQGKPHPEVYVKTARSLNFPPDKCVVFEDSLSGVEAAISAGCKVVGVATTYKVHEFNGVEFVINNFNDPELGNLPSIFK